MFWKAALVVLVAILLAGCETAGSNLPTGPAIAPAPQQEALEVTPRPSWVPEGAVQIALPSVPALAPEPVQLWGTPVPEQDMFSLFLTRGYALCPGEEIIPMEEGVAFVCAGTSPEGHALAVAISMAPGLSLADGPLPVGEGLAALIIVGAVGHTVYQAIDAAPRILMAQNPNILPPIPNGLQGVPEPPPHLRNHPRGAYTARLKILGWHEVFKLWANFAYNGGPPPDWCGQRSDGALLVYYASAVVTTTTGKAYQGFAVLVNRGGEHLSTVFPKVKMGQNGMPTTGNSSGNDFKEFNFIPPDRCPPPPSVVTQ